MSKKILVLWGSHNGIEKHKGENLRLLKRLIHLHHGIQVPDDRIVTGGEVAATYNSFIEDTAMFKYLYFVGHGDKSGHLMFPDGGRLDLGAFNARLNHFQTIDLYLFMCYEHMAYEKLRANVILNSLPIGIIRHEYTQIVGDEVNDRVFAYQLRLDARGVLTQTTDRGSLGNFFLCQEVEKAELERPKRQATQGLIDALFKYNAQQMQTADNRPQTAERRCNIS